MDAHAPTIKTRKPKLPGAESVRELIVMTLNFQYFATYPKDAVAAKARLHSALCGNRSPDVICVQEGLVGRDVLGDLGFELYTCSGREGLAQSVCDMVYADGQALGNCNPADHGALLCNQMYVRKSSAWQVVADGVQQISSDVELAGTADRSQGKLAIRSMAWLKLRQNTGVSVYVMCTHLSGGRFEDQYFVQQLCDERRLQTERALDFFHSHAEPDANDVGILVGDFNATTEYTKDGPMHGYYKASIASSAGVQADASAAGMQHDDQLEKLFKDYMMSPFVAIEKRCWTLAYDQARVGPTSGFGHLIDHMAMSRPLDIIFAESVHFTNQKFGNKPKDTDLPLTDHNAVKTIFAIPTAAASSAKTEAASRIASWPGNLQQQPAETCRAAGTGILQIKTARCSSSASQAAHCRRRKALLKSHSM